MRAKCTTTQKQFEKQIQNPNFVSILALGPEAAITIQDGIPVNCTV